MSLAADITVAAVVCRAGRFLVVAERIRHRLVFNQPAGHLEDRETLLEAVVREAREETAWSFRPEALLGVYLWRNPDSGISTFRFAFSGSVSDHRPEQPLDRGIVATHWLTRAELAARGPRLRSPLVLRCIDDHLAGKRAPLAIVECLGLDDVEEIAALAAT
ncbi:MAG: NUDIX hydrolase [Steroidobacteraceae bacterium]